MSTNDEHKVTDSALRQIFKEMDGNRAQEIREAYYKAVEGLMTLTKTLEAETPSWSRVLARY